MKILFTRNSSMLSNLIAGVTEEPVSHVALEFSSGIVIHSNLRGVHITWARNFKINNSVVLELSPTFEDTTEREKLDAVLEKYEFSFYDVGALLFLGICLFLRKYLKLPLPKSNLWQASGAFLCTEWAQELLDVEKDSMITPYQLYLRLKNSVQWLSVTENIDKLYTTKGDC